MSLKNETMKLKNWAVVGATTKKNRFGYKIVKKLKQNDYNVFPVNPKFEEVADLKCYPDLSSIENDIDVVDMVVNPKSGIKVMEEISKLGIKYVWLQPGTRSQEIRDFAAENNIELIEDCIYASL
ncbi:predicted CoA-binding protein [Halanaerobium saccharolyticum subsp. saccharolyticum DSM 6643]|uniref:Predicted CoA-binding protein n=1 Tax=Halanaerobium saccharolyticum subsp. saccharolyticum DSM 6643 TaxID=1293054 RepID=M5E515_9FIRM|nr:CoA-binding protein [Halanaerobium saccharolyticum]CCU81225.1 predicted CoA-binding protein [Halanaerobium saccharolyticum subsp. saccharolyticum DSM 6643]